ncbi:tetratricopeptide repeat protein [Sorangium sp. So ce134]
MASLHRIPRPLRGLAAVERCHARDDRAVELLTQALELAPEDVETLVALGDAHLARGRIDDAERWARAALEAAPEHAGALALMGHVLLRRGDVSGAREHAVWAIRTDVSDPDSLTLLAAITARELAPRPLAPGELGARGARSERDARPPRRGCGPRTIRCVDDPSRGCSPRRERPPRVVGSGHVEHSRRAGLIRCR